ncbi:UNVERIFIED_CONTAM: hypothetical protein Sradi_0940100 [Sesamum radiatum]|uniref:Uncharacterized protein n=1 Tax=Sesamum radiatum TaxID=300843 RepID=A0AAW2V570_SESRA
MFLCGAHKRVLKSSRSRGEKRTVRLGGEWRTWVKQRSNREGEEEEEKEEGEDGVVWKKTIIKGEKCRPLDFSGRILYDNDGNLLPD